MSITRKSPAAGPQRTTDEGRSASRPISQSCPSSGKAARRRRAPIDDALTLEQGCAAPLCIAQPAARLETGARVHSICPVADNRYRFRDGLRAAIQRTFCDHGCRPAIPRCYRRRRAASLPTTLIQPTDTARRIGPTSPSCRSWCGDLNIERRWALDRIAGGVNQLHSPHASTGKPSPHVE
jgi:hypothetical protein